MATTLLMPFRAPSSPLHQVRSKAKSNRSITATRSHTTSAVQPTKFELPDFLRDPRVESALVRVAPAPRCIPSVLNIHNSIAGMAGGALLASNPVTRRLYSQSLVGRSFLLRHDRRLVRNLLAHMEQTANRNPTSATAQNAFYQALLKASMPAIIVERYRSGRFASNAAADEAYDKALSLLSPVKQALAARSRGGNLAVNKTTSGTGAKDGPLHVVVDESFGSTFFRWFKFVLWFCLITYLSLVVITMLVESLSVFKRGAGSAKVDSEAKAENQKTKFSDVHGCDDAKEELQEMLPRGVLLVGPPGTGKTLLARAVAGEAGVPFFYMSGSEFDEVYVGVGAKRVRELFAAAKSKSPSIVFIDELDAIGGRRNARDATYVKQTLNQLLTELDGFDQNSGVIIMAATNFPQSLDKALTRPGRFDRHVNVELPDVRGRLAILQHHAKRVKAAKDVDLKAIAMTTGGLSGAELENIVNQAAVHASRAKASFVSIKDFDWAKDRVIMGAERKTMVITPEEKRMTAYHEAGHALLMLWNGEAKSAANSLYKMDKYSFSVQNYRSQIDVALGGKLAEEIVYGVDNVSSGASSDIQNATHTAFTMVAALGMSSKLGHMDYASRYENLSSETKAQIEAEVQRILNESYERCRKLLMERRKELDLLAQALVDYETLDKSEVEKVIRGEKLPDQYDGAHGAHGCSGTGKDASPRSTVSRWWQWWSVAAAASSSTSSWRFSFLSDVRSIQDSPCPDEESGDSASEHLHPD
ncbi:Mitochondrial inner membrane i-AAA protease supercomplex subunit YME1 [Apiospora phragmitis]|uniref:Mitochondrial inner membrane i-AAA protease supercomplex subunit YME1 n=1 Tax=Apiospora phragmitis TaxID=2905665 RepID=A0ABR1WTQ8_9PEZI